MYRKKTSSWLKHWDFILLDLILLELSYLLAHWLYHGTAYYREAPLYRNVFFAIAAIDLVVGLMMGSYKGILRRGYWLETKAVAKHAIIVTVCVIAYLFAMKESSNYSRVVIFAFPIISICVLYIGRILLKKWLSKHRGPASGKRAILLIGGKKNYREIVEAFTSNPYSEFHVMGIGIIDAKENEIPNYHGFPVFCGESAIEDFAQLNWVDEALFSIPTELPLPDKMIKNFGIMGITIHIKLARVADDSSNQIVEKLEGYTVLSTSINMVSAGQLIFKRTMDICGGLVGMLLTGIIFIFVALLAGCSGKKTEETFADAKNAESTDEKNTLDFVDAHGERYTVEINEAVAKNPYNKALFVKNENKISYEDKKYTSRLGVDVSVFQGDIDWEQVKAAGYEFAILRIGYRGYGEEGTLNADEKFEQNMENARKAGIDVGVYFFSQAVNEEEAKEEADFVLEHLKGQELQMPVVYDPEHILEDEARTDGVTGEQFTQNAKVFCKEIEEAGYDAMIYSNMLWEAYELDLEKLLDYPVWYADYEELPQTPYRFSMWQYSSTGSVPGIEGNVDLNIQLLKK